MPGFPTAPAVQTITDKLATIAPELGNVPGYYVYLKDPISGTIYESATPTDGGGNWSIAGVTMGLTYQYSYGRHPATAYPFQGAYVASNPPTAGNGLPIGKGGISYDVTAYLAKGDIKTGFTDGAITSGTSSFSSASAAFVAADVGKSIAIAGASVAAGQLLTTILTVQSSTTVLLATNASTTVTGAGFAFGTDDTPAFNNAGTAAAATRGSVNVPQAPGGTGYFIKRADAGVQNGGGIVLKPGVNWYGYGAKLYLEDNTQFFWCQSPLTSTVATVTGNIALGDTNLQVNSSAGFAVGREVFFRLGENTYDANETTYYGFAKVSAIPDGTHITIDKPVLNAVTVAGVTNALNKQLTLCGTGSAGIVENIEVAGFELISDTAAGANAEEGVVLQYARNCLVRDVVGQDVGAGLWLGQFAFSCRGYNLRVRQCAAPQASKGRAVTYSECQDCSVDGIWIEKFQGNAVFTESYSRNCSIRNVIMTNNDTGRVQTNALFLTGQGSDMMFENVRIEGLGGWPCTDNGTTPSFIQIKNLDILTSTSLKGLTTRQVEGRLRILSQPSAIAGDYIEVKRYSVAFAITANMVASSVVLPSGIYRRVKMYVSTTTGLTTFILTNGVNQATAFQASLVAGQVIDVTDAAGAGAIGSDFPFQNNSLTRQLALTTGGTVPASSYGIIEVEYWPPTVVGNALSPLTSNDASAGFDQELRSLFLVSGGLNINNDGSNVVLGNGYVQAGANAALELRGAGANEVGINQNLGGAFTHYGGTGVAQLRASTAGKLDTYNAIATQGMGVPAVYQAPAPSLAQTAAKNPIATVTSPNDGAKHVYRVSGTVTITTLGSGNIQLQVTYTDSNGTARTCQIPLCAQAGTFAASAATADDYKGVVEITVNPNTAVTVLTAGTFTGCTYNTSGQIEQIL